MAVVELSREEARRIAVRAQLLDANRPSDLIGMVRRLAALRADATAAVAPSADLIAFSRMGAAYDPRDLEHALDRRELVELDGFIRPMDDLSLYLDLMSRFPERESTAHWLDDNEEFRDDVLLALREDGPLFPQQIDDTSIVAWPSSGWNNNRNVIKMLECLHAQGAVAIVGRDGHNRRWDLAERVYPPDLPVIPEEEAARIRNERRLQALGIVRPIKRAMPSGGDIDFRDVGVEAEVEGTKKTWRVDRSALDAPAFEGRTALLSPFDQLIFERDRVVDLFEFDYTLEMYKPAAKRRWGYFALPILHDDRLVGKLDASSDRMRGRFVVTAVHEDEPFDSTTTDAVDAEIEALASFLELDLERSTARDR